MSVVVMIRVAKSVYDYQKLYTCILRICVYIDRMDVSYTPYIRMRRTYVIYRLRNPSDDDCIDENDPSMLLLLLLKFLIHTVGW
jgi:hypothetical protein